MKSNSMGDLKELIEKKEKEMNRLSNIEVMLNTVLDSIAGIHWWKDVNGVYGGCNQAMADALGLNSKEDIIGKTDYELPWSNQADILVKHDKIVMETGKGQLGKEEPVRTNDGKLLIFMVAKAALRNADGEVIGTVGNSVDITKQKKLETDITVAKTKAEAANAAKSEFIANMSHDIRTPITGMVGVVQDLLNTAERVDTQLNEKTSESQAPQTLAEMTTDLTHKIRSHGRLVMGGMDELLQMYNEILEVVSLDSGKMTETPESFDLHALTQHHLELLQPVAKHRNLTLSMEVDAAVPRYLEGLRIYLDRTLLNLMSNALKFTEEGSVNVIIQLTNNTSQKNIQTGDEVTLKIIVADTGIGIPKDKQEIIFEHFSRLSSSYKGVYKGTGLGLYTVKRYVDAMKGSIQIESEEGQGSRFILTLPFQVSDHADREYQSIRAPETSESAVMEALKKNTVSLNEANAHILVVEDSELAAMAINVALAPYQCAVDIAENGTMALEKVSNNTYDLIFMDVGLPDMEGTEVTKKIRALNDPKKAQTPIVALTGHAGDAEKRKECLDAGMEDVMSKPMQPLALESILERFVFDGKTPATKKPEPTSPTPDNQIIDWEGCVHMSRGKADIARELLAVLSKEITRTQKVVANAYAKKDITQLRAELHRCLGGVCYLRLPQLDETLRAFQTAVKAEPQHAEEIEATYTAFQAAIENFLAAWENETKLGT